MTDVFSVGVGPSAADARHSRKRKKKHTSNQNVDTKTSSKSLNHDGHKQHVKTQRKQRKNVNRDSVQSLEQPVVLTSSSRKKRHHAKKLKRKHKQTSA